MMQAGYQDVHSARGRAGCPSSCSLLRTAEDEEETLFTVETVPLAQQPPPPSAS